MKTMLLFCLIVIPFIFYGQQYKFKVSDAPVRSIDISESGNYLAICSYEPSVSVWELTSSKNVFTGDKLGSQICCFTENDQKLLTISRGYKGQITDLTSGKTTNDIKENGPSDVLNAVLSADKKNIFCALGGLGGKPRGIGIISYNPFQIAKSLTVNGSSYNLIDVNPSSTFIIAASLDNGGASIFDIVNLNNTINFMPLEPYQDKVPDEYEKRRREQMPVCFDEVGFITDNLCYGLYCAKGKSATTDIQDGKIVRIGAQPDLYKIDFFYIDNSQASATRIESDEKITCIKHVNFECFDYLFVAFESGKLYIYNVNSLAEQKTIKTDMQDISAIAANSDKKILALGNKGFVAVWDLVKLLSEE